MLTPVVSFVKNALLQRPVRPTLQLDKLDASLSPNMRALRLTASIADHLLSMGVAASDVVHLTIQITRTYCTQPVHMDISYNLMTISQDRGNDREPLTLMRTVDTRATNYHTMQRLFELTDRIRKDGLPLGKAEDELDDILAKTRSYPRWVSHLASGAISAGVALLYTTSPLILIMTLVMGVMVSLLMYRLTKSGIPIFYSQALAAGIVTVIAAGVSWLAMSTTLPILDGVNPTIIVISGIVLLVTGMMIVAAFQDAIDEYYITAGARLFRVVMLTGAIVMGVALGLYLAKRIGIVFMTTPDQLSLTSTTYQYIGAGVVAAAFALFNQARWVGIVAAGVVGCVSLYTVLLATNAGLGIIPASGLAAGVVGLAATILWHYIRIPTSATIGSGIIPLVPGLSLYNGLTYTIQSAPQSAQFDEGLTILLRALLIALAIAAGATLGNIIGRPTRRRLIYLQNRLPKPRFGRRYRRRRRYGARVLDTAAATDQLQD